MNDKVLTPDTVKHVCESLCLPLKCCQLLSNSRLACIVTGAWIRSLHHGQIITLTEGDHLDPCKAERYLSKSCDKIPEPWIKLSMKVVAKSNELYKEIPSQCSQQKWSCGSLYEFLSHISKENLGNLWLQAHHTLRRDPILHRMKSNGIKFTDLVRRLLRSMNPNVYVDLQHGEDVVCDQEQLSSTHSDTTSTTAADNRDSPDFNSSKIDSDNLSIRSGSFYTTTSETYHFHGLPPIDIVIELESHFLIIQPYYPYTLSDVLSFSPAVLKTSHAKPLFIVYQLLNAMEALHNQGLRMFDTVISDIIMDKNMWLRLSTPRFSNLQVLTHDPPNPTMESESIFTTPRSSDAHFTEKDFPFSPENASHQIPSVGPSVLTDRLFQGACEFVKSQKYTHFEVTSLENVVERWVNRQITNFQYLMVLNHLAGRRMGDPNNHPVLPWVLDFSSPNSGYRDLTRSKFRLNKGDGQLDFTFQGMGEALEVHGHIPHHVSDILSDITYYVYKARRIPKDILCAHVRSNWVPHEYPVSMQRLYDWTPDECIPEFFTDPSIFDSIHDDLPDLEIPPWCKNTLNFVVQHLAALESDHVSSNIHHWIDLTFGYKLQGVAAVNAKNVHLRLVDQHTHLDSHGTSQLFLHPHPQRGLPFASSSCTVPRITRGLLNFQLMTYGLPDPEPAVFQASSSTGSQDSSEQSRISQSAIYLPRSYNPLAQLEQCEALQEFRVKAMHVPAAHQSVPAKESLHPDFLEEGVTDDMVTFLCLVCEMFLDSKLRMQDSRPPLWKRVKAIKKICSPDFSEIQRPLQKFVLDMFESLEVTTDKKFVFQAILPDGMPPATPGCLLQSYSDFIPFPPYFGELYTTLSKLEEKSLQVEKLRWSMKPYVERCNNIKQLEREKVPLLESFLWRHQGYLGTEGMSLVLPYIQDLLQNEYTTVQAAWSLFDVITRELGPVDASKQFLPSLTALFCGEVSTAKHIKLYHRSFLIQLVIRLGLKTFLGYFSTLLVEAVAGYKNFSISSRFYPEELLEDLNLDSLKSEPSHMVWPKDEFEELSDCVDGLDEADINEVGDAENNSHSDIDSAIVDWMSLNAGHVLLENEDIDRVSSKASDGDTAESDSLCSESSEEKGDQDSITDSIHSISMPIKKQKKESLAALTSEEPEIIYDSSPNDLIKSKVTNSSGSSDTFDAEGSSLQSGDLSIKEQASSSCSTNLVHSVEQENPSSELDFVDAQEVDKDSLNRFDGQRSSSDMVRSETDDLMLNLSSDGSGSIINISNIAADSVKWLSYKLGPVLATKFLSRNLLRMLALCYLGQEQLQFVEKSDDKVMKTSRLVEGDKNSHKILQCIGFTVVLYGEQIILIQCLPNIFDMISVAQKRFSSRAESSLFASVVLLAFLIPYFSDATLMNVLEEGLINNCISPVLSLIISPNLSFPGGALARFVLCHKLIDLMYILGLRLGFEMTRKFLNESMLRLMNTFSSVHGQASPVKGVPVEQSFKSDVGSYGSDDSFLTIKMDALTHQYTIGSPVDLRSVKIPPKRNLSKMHSLSSIGVLDEKEDFLDSRSPTTVEKCAQELKCVFSPELAEACYIPLCRIFGSIHMGQHLHNDDLIRQLCAQHDVETDVLSPSNQDDLTPTAAENSQFKDDLSPTDDNDVVGGIGSNVAVIGNRIQITDAPHSTVKQQPNDQFGRGYKHSGILSIHHDDLRCQEMEQNQSRHLRGNWLAYWERELGLHERNTMFNFMQIELQTFTGHTSSIRSIHTLDTENCFISASKDKTVRLWSIDSCGDGTNKQSCQFCYSRHKKSVFSVAYVESVRLVASCDSTVHVWDPYTGVALNQLESPKHAPVVALTALPAPSTLVAIATTEATLRFLDMRTAKYTHDFRSTVGNTGLIRCMAVSPDRSWIAVGFSSGIIYIIDITSGVLQHSWKAHDGEILQLKAYCRYRLLSSAFDQTIKLWNVETGLEVCPVKSQTEPIHCLSLYRDQVLSATTANRISVYASATDSTASTSSKLKSGTFKGVLTNMSVLPMNKALLLGADNGVIKLMA